jgi:hypothetical protein
MRGGDERMAIRVVKVKEEVVPVIHKVPRHQVCPVLNETPRL